ncbi:hypothetical protein CAPTEDRAFT_158296 [Capitella teleta]|uniref:Synapsin-1 n=1 Tax=Capitella teleta TaxID=283909 RepID=R7USE1_CAPTE|nr:hypothetical protein CAPTEDRAFT_158296 [Capitella teleta]|eukprot:ELU06331.1 hypothetical protein CAPTEDRAFT_158296 [Capitella teleta]
MNFLRRRFSSSDLQGELADSSAGPQAPDNSGFSFNFPKKGPSPSAPSSPSKSSSSVQGITRSLINAAQNAATGVGGKAGYNKERCKTLLVIDDQHTDWSKYFKGRKIFGDWDIRIEQATFSEINLAAYTDSGTVVDIQVTRNGTKVVRSFKPDFVLVRQHVRDANENWKNIILGLQYGGIPSLNSLNSIFNFLEKPWVFAHLIQIQKRLGKDRFPLIEQSYYPNHKEMVSNLWLVTPKFPVVVKIGHAHSGMGKVKINNHYDFQDIASVVAVTNCYSSTEPFVDGKYDIHIQKIGSNYKAFMRKSISGNWKANTGSAMLEQITMTERYKTWVDECSQLFGGLDMLAVEGIHGKDGKEYIIEVNDSSMGLLGESQEEDRRLIADLVLAKMEVYCKPVQTTISKTTSAGALMHYAMNGEPERGLPDPSMAPPPPQAQQPPPPQMRGAPPQRQMSTPTGAMGGGSPRSAPGPDRGPPQQRAGPPGQRPNAPDSLPRGQAPPPMPRPQGPASPGTVEAIARELQEPDQEDTMKNLRKTFAGIFGDM